MARKKLDTESHHKRAVSVRRRVQRLGAFVARLRSDVEFLTDCSADWFKCDVFGRCETYDLRDAIDVVQRQVVMVAKFAERVRMRAESAAKIEAANGVVP